MKDESASQFLRLLETPQPAGLGPESRAGRKSVAELEAALAPLFAAAKLDSQKENLARSILFLWHDHLDESHALSQNISSDDGSFVHGIMHRREPDYGNAAYWFRRAGQHRVFAELGQAVAAMEKTPPQQSLNLTAGGGWNPLKFIDAVSLARGQDQGNIEFLQKVQQLESTLLLANILRT